MTSSGDGDGDGGGGSGLLEGTQKYEPLHNVSGDANSEEEVTKLKTSLHREKAAKRKMYSYLVKIADELKTLRNESEQLIGAAEYARKAWYEGGMWRGENDFVAFNCNVS